ncbi:hypothetical protein Emag_004332 [Eimeria magna]
METPQGTPQGKREAERPSSQHALDHAGDRPQEEALPLAADLSGPEEATEQQQGEKQKQEQQEEDEEEQEKGEEQQQVWPERQQQQPRQQQQQHQQQGRQQQQQVLPDVAQRQPSVGEVEALTQQLVLLQKLIEEGRGTSDMQQLLAAASAAAAPLPLATKSSSSSSGADGVRRSQPGCLPALLDGARCPSGSPVSHEGVPQQQQQQQLQQALVVQEAASHLQPVESCAVRGASLSSAVPSLVLQGPDTIRPLGRQSHNSTWRPPTGAPPGLGGPFEGGVSYQGTPSYRAPFLSTSSNRSFSFGGRGAVTPQGRGSVVHQANLQLGPPNGLRSPLQAEDGVFGSAFSPTMGGGPREQGSLIPVGPPLMGPQALLHLGPPHSAAGTLPGHHEDPSRGLGVGPPPPSLDSLEALLSRQQQQQQRRGPRGIGGVGPHGAQSVMLRRSPPRAKSVYFFCPSCLESYPASSLSLFAAHVSQKGHVVQQLQRLRGPDGYYRCPKCTCKGSDLLGLLRHWQEGGAAHHGQKILKHIRAREPPVKPSQPVAIPSLPRLQQQNQLALLHQQQQQQQQMLLLQEAGVVGPHSLQGRCRRRGTREGDSEVSPSQYPLYPVGPHHLRPQGASQSEESPSVSHRGGGFPPHIAQDGWTGPPLLRDVRGAPRQPSVGPLGVDFHRGSISQKSSGLSDEASDESLLQTQQQQEQQEQLQQQQREEALRCLMGLSLSSSGGPGEARGGVAGAGLRSSSPLAEETLKAVPFRRGFRGLPSPPLFGPRLELPEGPRLAAGQGLPSSFEEGASGGSEDGRVAPARGSPAKGVWGLPQQHSHEQQRDMMESQPLQHQQQRQQQQIGVSSVPSNFLGNRGVPSALQQPAADCSIGPSCLESFVVWASPSEPRGGP